MPLEERLRRLAGALGLVAAAIGLIALLGWTSGAEWLAFGLPPMRPLAAVSVVSAGLALWCLHRDRWPRAGLGCAGASLVLALGALAQTAFGFSLPARSLTGGVSEDTAFVLGLVGVALLFLRQSPRPRWPISAWLANLLMGLGAASLLSTALSENSTVTPPLRLPVQLSVSIIVLGVGTLVARANDRHVRILFARTAAGVLARRLFLGVAVLPTALASALAWARRHHAIDVDDGLVLFVVAMIVCGFAVALFSVDTAAGINEDKEEAEQARHLLTARLQEQAMQLQETVNQRTRELREANASLRAAAESNALLALVAQNTINGVVITDAQGRVEWVNTAFERLSGYTLAEVKGRKPGHFLQGPESDMTAVARMRSAEQRGEPLQIEVVNYTKQGRPFWVRMDIQPVRDDEGRLVNFVANQVDVSEARATQARLLQLSQRFQLATRAAELGVWEWDTAHQRCVWDERTLEIYGLRADEFKGTREDWERRVHPEDHARVLQEIHDAMAESDSYEFEFRIRRASDGAERHLQARAIIQRDAQGRVARITGTERDITAERTATQQMEVLNERLRLALRSSNYGVWEIDIATGRRHWDARMFEIYGVKPEEFTATSADWRRVLHPEDREAAFDRAEQVMADKINGYEDRYRVIRPDNGAERYIEAHGYLHRDAQGRPVRLVGMVRDITEHKQMEQALDLAEQRWQLAIEGTNDSVWDWDVVTGSVYHDERWARMLGYEPGELPNTIDGWKALAHPDDLAENEAAIQEHFAQRTPFYQHELRMRTRDGHWRWILDRGKVVRRGADGRPLRMAGTHTDVTARKQLEERLRKTEELANEVSRLAQIGGWEFDYESMRVIWNEGTRRIHEVDDSFQPTLDSVYQFFPPEAMATIRSTLDAMTPAEPAFDLELPLLTARGRRIWVRILGHGEFRGQKVTSVRGAIQDITARHESEQARRELETQLFQAQKMETLGTLAGGIAHDFNNLLTGIIGYHELAADSVPEDHPARICLNEARNASLRARELVEQILTFGRQSGGTEHAPIDLSLVIEEARRFLRATLPANITIEVACGSHCPAVLADATQIHQVILNLGSNAAHAMRQHGGTLHISLEQTEVSPDLALTLGGPAANSYVRLSVRDTGHGMDESTRRRIFDPFFTTKNTREGTGLGLAVVHGIVRSHRGAIDVESSPGHGSTFHIYLPTAESADAQHEVALGGAPRGGGEYVCVVDDEEVVGSCTKLVLESRGYRTLIFSSAEHCLEEMKDSAQTCAVLLTDQTMPGMQGTELAAALRRIRPDLPIVIMSGYFSKISPQALDELGQVELLAKPFTTDELAMAIHRALHPTERVLT